MIDNLNEAVSKMNHGRIKCPTAKVVHEPKCVFSLALKSVGQRSRHWLLEKRAHLDPGNLGRSTGCLRLGLVKCSRHCDDGGLQILLCIVLKYLQDFSR